MNFVPYLSKIEQGIAVIKELSIEGDKGDKGGCVEVAVTVVSGGSLHFVY